MKHFKFYFIILAFAAGCSGTKTLPPGATLYKGAELNLQSQAEIPKKGQLKAELQSSIKPEPNGTFLGMRPRVWIYNITRDTADSKGIDGWINKNLGAEPVLLSEVYPRSTVNILESQLFNKGFFDASVNYTVNSTKNTAAINYTANVSSPYRLDSIYYPDSVSVLTGLIRASVKESELKQGSTFDLSKLVAERERISNYLRNRGYYYFSPEHLLFEVDTTVQGRKLDIYANIKETIPEKVTRRYRLNEVIIKPGYDFDESDISSGDTLNIEGYRYISTIRDLFRPRVIMEAIFLQPDSIYSKQAHDQTLRRLINLNIFQFVNIKFEEVGDPEEGRLNTIVQLIPDKRKSIRFELEAVSKSNDYVGPSLTATFRNKNFLGGAELFELNLFGGFETQFTQRNDTVNFNSYEVGLEANLFIPRFITPFNIRNTSSYYVPKTRFKLAYRRLNRVAFFELNSFNASVAYLWNETHRKRHELSILDVNFFNLSNTTGLFRQKLNDSEYLQRSFDESFILSTNYSFTYNSRQQNSRSNGFFFNGIVDFSGNLMHLLQSAFREEQATDNEPYSILGIAYSQYARFLLDTRYYYQIDRKNELAFRLFAGAGIPYGNSNTLPFVKQFFIGGTNSIRAFPARALGPGTFNPDSSAGFYDQSGDIKLEMNMEYRFPIYGFIKGALFLEAGNIWLLREPEERPGAVFEFDRFMDQLAVGSGAGIRLDVDFLVLRLDLGIPLRKPFLAKGSRWYFDQLGFDDIVYNIGIGYPF